MVDKYLIKLDNVTIGFKYNHKKGIAVLGGHKDFRLQCIDMLKRAFKQSRYKTVNYLTRNIIRFTFRTRDSSRIDEGITWMMKNGYIVETVKRLEFIR